MMKIWRRRTRTGVSVDRANINSVENKRSETVTKTTEKRDGLLVVYCLPFTTIN